MIPKILVLFLGVSFFQVVYGVAYSQVYVQNGAEVIPVEYVNYGAPRVVTNRKIAALSAPPIGSALPLPNVVSPCVAPCVAPSQTAGRFAPVPNAKIIYSAPSVPAVVVPTNDEKTSYEYSYVVYDEDTGDKKAQRELSDGSVVHGEYSFIQPDGYVREVKYTADDLTGFNAVVKSFLPESVFGNEKKKTETKEKSEPPPCKETKSEALKLEPDHDQRTEKPKPEHIKADKPVTESHNAEAHIELSVVPVDHTPTEYVPEHAAEEIISHNNKNTPERVAAHFGESPAEHAAHTPDYAPEYTLAPEKSPGPILEQTSKPHTEHLEIIFETPEEHAKHGPHHAEVAHPAEPAEQPLEPAQVDMKQSTAQPSPVELTQAPSKDDCDQKTHAAVQAPNSQVSIPNGLATYSDILRCIQAAIANRDGNTPNISPLTYIILPGANKPC